MSEGLGMSIAAVEEWSTDGSADPTVVVGNNDGSGSLRAPQSNEVNMTVIEGKTEDAIALLVLEWQSSSGGKQKRIGDQVMRLLLPALRKVAGAFIDRGVLREDLEQVAALAAFRLFSKPINPNYTFEGLACFRARSACREHVAIHGSDVHVSDWGSRSRQTVDGVVRTKRGQSEAKVSIESRDEDPTNRREASIGVFEVGIGDDQLIASIDKLSPSKREVVKAFFGIDQTEQSLRSMSERFGVSRARLSRMREEALSDLHAMLR